MVTQKQTHVTHSTAQHTASGQLSSRQLITVCMIGIALWFVAALAVQFGSAAGLFEPTMSVIMFALALPIAWISIAITNKVAQLQGHQRTTGIALGTAAAALCDGIALTWFRDLYGSDPNQVVIGAAWILWGVGCFIFCGYLTAQRQIKH